VRWPRAWELVSGVGELVVSESGRGLLQFSPCELLLLEAGSSGTRPVQEPRGRGTSAIGSHYQYTGEGIAG
jgi:hypothetical protein